jgi:hypothetical protein
MHLDDVPCEFLEPAHGLSGLDRRGIGKPLIAGFLPRRFQYNTY